MSAIDLLNAVVLAFSMVFLMELGDKTQIMSFSLATRYRSPYRVFAGVITGLSLVTMLGILIGLVLKSTLDMSAIQPFIGVIFIVSGLIFLYNSLKQKNDDSEFTCPFPKHRCPHPDGKCDNPENCKLYIQEVMAKGAFRNSLVLSFLAELGDKTMLMAIGLTTQVDTVGVLIGAVAALAAVNLTGVLAGEWLSKYLPRDKLELLGAGLFVLTGLLIILL